MRGGFCLIVLVAITGCRSRIPAERPRELYGGVGVVAVPQVGGSLTAGQHFATTLEKFDFAFELRTALQGGTDSATQDGRLFQVQAGIKQVASPGHRSHLLFRYGLVWFRATGDPNLLDSPGDYLGAYGGVGYEWDLSPRVTLGPELDIIAVNGEGHLGFEVLPQLALNLIFNF